MKLYRLSGFATLLALAVTGCMTLGTEPINLLTTEQEVALGQKLAAQVEQQAKLLADGDIQSYVVAIGDRLARVSTRQDVPYTFKVIDAPKTVNAFALPGGNMYIYTGLMTMCENEAELAAVMAHEMAHVAAYHHGQNLTRQYGYNLLVSILLGDNPNEAAQLVANILGTTVQARFSREQENQADALGMEFLFRAGYSPHAMVTFMNKLVQEEMKSGGRVWLPIFASHPPTEERLAVLQSLETRYPLPLTAADSLNANGYRRKILTRLAQ